MALTCPNCGTDQAVAVLTAEDGYKYAFPCLFCDFANFRFRSNELLERGTDLVNVQLERWPPG